jgi:hypothetical protein
MVGYIDSDVVLEGDEGIFLIEVFKTQRDNVVRTENGEDRMQNE